MNSIIVAQLLLHVFVLTMDMDFFCFCVFVCVCMGVGQGFEFIMLLNMTLNSWFSFITISSSGVLDVQYNDLLLFSSLLFSVHIIFKKKTVHLTNPCLFWPDKRLVTISETCKGALKLLHTFM